MILLYIVPILFQILYPIILNSKKLNVVYIINSVVILSFGFFHYYEIENELSKSNFHCGMPLIVPFFITIFLEVVLIIIYIIQIFVLKKFKNNKNVYSSKPQ